MQITIEGLDNLLNRLDTLGIDINKGLEKGIEKSAIRLESDTKRNITALGAVDTGTLKNSITTQIDGLNAEVGTPIEYAKFVHDGTGIYNPEGRRTPWVYKDPKTGNFYTTKGMQPRPFLRNAYEQDEEKMVRDVANEIRKEIDKR